MAVIPRYFSESNATPAINTVKMDPGVAAAPYRAAEQATANFMNVFQNEMGQWSRVVAAKEAEQKRQQEKQMKVQEGLYKAEALANLRIQANQAYQQGLLQSNGSPDFANQFDAHFQKLADPIIQKAPTPEAQIALTKQLIGMRAQYNIRAMNDSTRLGNQVAMDALEGALDRNKALAEANPELAPELLNRAEDIFAGMRGLTLPSDKVEEIKNNYSKDLQFIATKSEIEKDPLTGLERLEKGDFTHLGSQHNKDLRTFAQKQVATFQKDIGGKLDDTISRLVSGLPIRQDIDNLIDQANKFNLQDKAGAVITLREIDQAAAGMNLNALRNAKNEIELRLARGELAASPEEAKKVMDYFDGNIKAMKEDPLRYGELKAANTYTPLPDITDFREISPEQLEQRRMRSLQMEVALGVPSPALKGSEVANLANQLTNATTMDKLKILQNVQAMGDRTAQQVATALSRKDPALSVAASSGIRDPELAIDIIKGQELLKAKATTALKEPEWTAAADDVLKGFMDDDPNIKAKYISAAKAVAAARGITDAKEALRDVSGIVEMDNEGIWQGNYKTVPPVKGMSSTDFTNLLIRNLENLNSKSNNHENWVKYGNGVPVSAGGSPIDFSREDPTDFQFIYDGSGTYGVSRGGKRLVNEDGTEYRIDLGKLVKDDADYSGRAYKKFQEYFSR